MINGVINVYKEKGFTSHDVVAKLRGIAGQRKIGHTGTLDPDAAGVLPVCLGSATKLCDMLTDETKEYEACLQLGVVTDTQDMSGRILEEKPVNVTEEMFRQAAESFIGEYDQIPPMYSALKINGRKLYELARAGKTVERKARRVQILSLEIVSVDLPQAVFRVTCSKGTYIRTLCQDIGEKLGCGGAMRTLKRTRVGRFAIGEAFTLSQIQEKKDRGVLREVVLPVDKMFENLKAVCVTEEGIRLAENGNGIPVRLLSLQTAGGNQNAGNEPRAACSAIESVQAGFTDGEQVRLYDGTGRFYGIFKMEEKTGFIRPVKMFLEREE